MLFLDKFIVLNILQLIYYVYDSLGFISKNTMKIKNKKRVKWFDNVLILCWLTYTKKNFNGWCFLHAYKPCWVCCLIDSLRHTSYKSSQTVEGNTQAAPANSQHKYFCIWVHPEYKVHGSYLPLIKSKDQISDNWNHFGPPNLLKQDGIKRKGRGGVKAESYIYHWSPRLLNSSIEI